MIHLDEPAIRALLSWNELIGTMEDALAEFSLGGVQQPVRTLMEVQAQKRYFGIMAVVAKDLMGAKLVSFYPVNAAAGLHTHYAIIVLFRSDIGAPLATLDGGLITEMRTAAVPAAITKYAAPPSASRRQQSEMARA